MDVFELEARLSADTSQYDAALAGAEGKAGSFASNVGGAIGGGLKAAAAVGVAAIGSATAAIGALTKSAVDGYSAYEQLSGGIETLFGAGGATLEQYATLQHASVEEVKGDYESLMSAQQTVMDNAANAYKTAGMSANEYMDTVTSFSAALIQSVGGDTQKAAEMADVAITDMADNANKMGSSIESIQNAYQGFAKQNYTMLDNLKLGYGGTQQEMYRLLSDAAKIDEQFAKTAEFSLDSKNRLTADYADIVQAIHIMQTEMNISGMTAEEAAEAVASGAMTQEEAFLRMGTTAKEGSTTIEGSFNTLKGAWDNLVAGFSNPDADIGKLFDQMMDALVGSTDEAGNHINGFADNVIPAIEQAVSSIGQVIGERLPEALSSIGDYIGQVAPDILSAAVDLVGQIAATLPETLGQLADAIPGALATVVDKIKEEVPNMGRAVSEGISGIVDGMGDLSSQLAPVGEQVISGIGDALSGAATGLMNNGPEIISGIAEGITGALDGLADIGAQVMESIGNGFAENGGSIIESLMTSLNDISGSIRENAGQLVDAGIEMILKLAEGFSEGLPSIIENLPEIVSNIANVINDNAPKLLAGGVKLIVTLGQGIIQAIPTLVANIPKIVSAIIDVWSAVNWMNLGKTLITKLKEGVTTYGPKIIEGLKTIAQKAMEGFRSVDWAGLGSKVIKLVADAVKTFGPMIIQKLKEVGKSAIEKFKEVDWKGLGKSVIDGIVKGVTGAASNLFGALKNLAGQALEKAKEKLKINSPSKVFRDEVGHGIGEGMALGVTDSEKEVGKASEKLALSSVDAMKGALEINSPAKVLRDQVGFMAGLGLSLGLLDSEGKVTDAGRRLAGAVVSSTSSAAAKTQEVMEGASQGAANYWNQMGQAVVGFIDAHSEELKGFFGAAQEAQDADLEKTKSKQAEKASVVKGSFEQMAAFAVEKLASIEASLARIAETVSAAVQKMSGEVSASAGEMGGKIGESYDEAEAKAAEYSDNATETARSGDQARLQSARTANAAISADAESSAKRQQKAARKAAMEQKNAYQNYFAAVQEERDKDMERLEAALGAQSGMVEEGMDGLLDTVQEKSEGLAGVLDSVLMSIGENGKQWAEETGASYDTILQRAKEFHEGILASTRENNDERLANTVSTLGAMGEEEKAYWEKVVSEGQNALGRRLDSIREFFGLKQAAREGDAEAEAAAVEESTEKSENIVADLAENIQNRVTGLNNAVRGTFEAINDTARKWAAKAGAPYDKALDAAEKYNEDLVKSSVETNKERLKDDEKYLKDNDDLQDKNTKTKIPKAIKKARDKVTDAIPKEARIIGQASMEAFGQVNWPEIGLNIIKGILQGIQDNEHVIFERMVTMAMAAKKAAEDALEIKSPSKVFRFDIGRQIANGVAMGIVDRTPYAVKVTEDMAKEIMDSAKKTLDNSKVYNEWGIDAEAAYWDTIRRYLKKGTEQRIAADKEYFEARKEMYEQMHELEVSYAVNDLNGVVMNTRQAAATVKKISRGSYEELLENATKWLDNYKVYHEVSLGYEKSYWDRIRNMIAAGTAERVEADKNYFDIVDEMAENAQKKQEEREEKAQKKEEERQKKQEEKRKKSIEKFVSNGVKAVKSASVAAMNVYKTVKQLGGDELDAARTWLESYQVYHETSLEYEKEYWDSIRRQYKRGTKARMEADKKYFAASKAIREEAAAAKAEAAEATLQTFLVSGAWSKGSLFDAAGQLIAKAKGDYEKLLSMAESWLTNRKALQDVSIKDEMKYWREIAQAAKAGTKERLDAEKKYYDALEKLQEENEKKAKERAERITNSYILAAVDSRSTASGAANSIYKKSGGILDAISLADKWLDNHWVYMEKSLKYEAEYWDALRKNYKEGTEERIEADKKYFAARKAYEDDLKNTQDQENAAKLAKQLLVVNIDYMNNAKDAAARVMRIVGQTYGDLVSSAQEWLSNRKVYYQTSLRYEMDYWNDIRKQAQAGTKARLEADQQYFAARRAFEEARKSARENARQLTDEYLSSYDNIVKERNDNIKNIREQLALDLAEVDKKILEDLSAVDEELENNIKSRNEQLTSDIQSLTDAYNSSVESRAQSLMGMTSLFERTAFDRTYSKEYLADALAEQLKDFEAWDNELDKLQARLGRDNPLLKALQEMGVSSLYTLQEVNSMSEEELKNYSNLYAKKTEISNARARQENEALLEETQTQIAGMRRQAQADIDEFRRQAEDSRREIRNAAEAERAEIIAAAEADIETLKSEAAKQVKELEANYKADLKELSDTIQVQGLDVGDAMCQGIAQGIRNGAGGVAAEAAKVAADALSAAMAQLDAQRATAQAAAAAEAASTASNLANMAKEANSAQKLLDKVMEEANMVEETSQSVSTSERADRMAGNVIQNLTVNSPTALSPSEVARQTRLANQQMVLSLRMV